MSTVSKAPKHPLITVLGATGTGKSELAVSLAQKFNGEIINGDSLQLYQGLPIVTNKISTNEQHGIKHHLLGTIPLSEPTWTVTQFTTEAIRLIEDIRNRGKIPILVGGTHYYLRATLFKDALVPKDTDEGNALHEHLPSESTKKSDPRSSQSFITPEEELEKWPILKSSPEEIRAELHRVDPVMAKRWHPNDHRKIRRSLAIYLQTGRPASEIYAEQEQCRQALLEGADDVGLPASDAILRYDNLLLWTHSKFDVLETRLADRVDKMISRGLLEEIRLLDDVRHSSTLHGSSVDDPRGIWSAIGYKEFASYLSLVQDSNIKQPENVVNAALERGKEATFFATRQYARYQIKWIRNTLAPSLKANGIIDKLFLLDSTDIGQFKSMVENKASNLTDLWLNGHDLPSPWEVSAFAAEVLQSLTVQSKGELHQRTCELCGVTTMTDEEWTAHPKTKKHKRAKQQQSQAALQSSKSSTGQVSKATDEVESSNEEGIGLAELSIAKDNK